MKNIEKGSTVKYKDGWMRVTARFTTTVNLGPIFGSNTTVKKVAVKDVVEDYDSWSKHWGQSETYMSM